MRAERAHARKERHRVGGLQCADGGEVRVKVEVEVEADEAPRKRPFDAPAKRCTPLSTD